MSVLTNTAANPRFEARPVGKAKALSKPQDRKDNGDVIGVCYKVTQGPIGPHQRAFRERRERNRDTILDPRVHQPDPQWEIATLSRRLPTRLSIELS